MSTHKSKDIVHSKHTGSTVTEVAI